ncbi:MAG TPA: Calx-beta domain-containing protein [Verrucomicrobiae bacterium]|nr:Calx-beta domain-containing protein [Verrucomicrobiae bacterium]
MSICSAPIFFRGRILFLWLVLGLVSSLRPAFGAPGNDAFANRPNLVGASGSILGTMIGATTEPGEPPGFGIPDGGSIWYSWTSPVTGKAVLVAGGDIFNEADVFTGGSLAALVVVSNRSEGYVSDGTYVWDATNNVTYQIRIRNWLPDDAFDGVDLGWRVDAPPPNDDLAHATLLNGLDVVMTGSLAGATREVGEPGVLGNTIWFRWAAPVAGRVTASSSETFNRSSLEVYSGSLFGGLTPVINIDPAVWDQRRMWRTGAGSEYYLQISMPNNTLGGPVQLSLRFDPYPVNDDFSNATTINGSDATVTGRNIGATSEVGEPRQTSGGPHNSVWWKWTAPASGEFSLSTDGSTFDTVLTVYSGAVLAGLHWVAADDDSDAGLKSRVVFRSVAGETYLISVAGFGGFRDEGTISLRLRSQAAAVRPAVSAAALPNVKLTKEGIVNSLLVQADRKIIVAGTFSAVNAEDRQNLARLNVNGTLDLTWAATVEGEVRVMCIHSNDLFLGGTFTVVNGVRRAGLAKLSLQDGSLDADWDVPVGGSVDALVVTNGWVFVGGWFNSIGGLALTNLAKATVASPGLVQPNWTLRPSEGVRALLLHGGDVFVNGKRRLDQQTGIVSSWNPVRPPGDPLFDGNDLDAEYMVVIGTNLIVAGVNWPSWNSVLRVGLAEDAKYDPDWRAGFGDPGDVQFAGLTSIGNTLFVMMNSPEYFDLNSVYRLELYPSQAPSSWENPTFASPRYVSDGFDSFTASTSLRALASDGSRVIVGGGFGSANGVRALCLGAFDPVTGRLDPEFSAHVQRPGSVLAMGQQPDGKLVIGGEFAFIGELARGNIARFNPDGSLDDSWFPEVDGAVTALDANESGLFIGGYFGSIGGTRRQFLAKMDTAGSSGPDLSWDADTLISRPDHWDARPVRDLAVIGNKLFVAGAGEGWTFAVLDAATAAVEFTNSADISRIVKGPPGKVTVAGKFTEFAGTPRAGLARLDANSPYALDSAWAPPVIRASYQEVAAVAVDSSNVFVAVESYPDPIWSLQKFQVTGSGAAVSGWAPPEGFRAKSGDSISSLASLSSHLYVGGMFWPVGAPAPPTGDGGNTILLRLDASTGVLDGEWNGGASADSGPANVLLVSGNKLFIGGQFARLGEQSRFGLAELAVPSAPVLLKEANGRIVILRNPQDGPEVTHFRILAVSGGALSHCASGLPVAVGDFISVAEAEAGLCFASSGGSALITAVSATGQNSASTAVVPASLDPLAASAPVFSFSQEEYAIEESKDRVNLTILKRGLGGGTVRVVTSNGTAVASQLLDPQDFRGGTAFVTLNVGVSNLVVPIFLDQDDQYEGDETFYVHLAEPSSGARLGFPAVARVVIKDDDRFGPGGSFLSNAPPAARLVAAGTLTIQLAPAEVGQWRLAGEWDWHASGETVTGLIATNYEVEFKEFLGYAAPARRTIPILAGQPTVEADSYTASDTPSSRTAELTVVLGPPELADNPDPEERAEWRLRGQSTWRPSGAVMSGLSVGFHEIELKPLSNYLAQTREPVIWIDSDRIRTNYASYIKLSGVGTLQPRVLDLATATGTAPYFYNGQIKTPLGVGSGVVVRERVVLTVAHLLFDEDNLSSVGREAVYWMFQRHAGSFEPVRQIPYGTAILDGYASQRKEDHNLTQDRPVGSTPGSQNLDVALLFFQELAGRGGYGGFMAAENPNLHLLSSRLKTLVGYPKDGIDPNAQGKLHATPMTTTPFELLYPGKSVYVTSALKSFPGNSGGPLYVESEIDHRLYPVGVYLGQNAVGASLVRAIDETVVDYINRGHELTESGQNHPGGGWDPYIPGVTKQPIGTGLLTIWVQPQAARVAGAGWRILQNTKDTSYVTNEFLTYALTGGVDYDLVFRPAPAFITPANQLIRVNIAEISTLKVRYAAWPGELALEYPFGLRFYGSNQGRYEIQYSDRLGQGALWLPWTNVIPSSPVLLDIPVWNDVSQRFYRVKLTPP